MHGYHKYAHMPADKMVVSQEGLNYDAIRSSLGCTLFL